MNQPHTQVVIVKEQGNALGLAGLIFSVLGWLTCGILCPLGALLSFFGLFSRGPKAIAVAGLIVGFPGVAFFALFGLGFILTFLGIGGAAIRQASEAAQKAREAQSGMVASSDKTLVPTKPSMDPLTIPAETPEPPLEPPKREPTPEELQAAKDLQLAEEQKNREANAARDLEMAAKERELRVKEEQAEEKRKAIEAVDYRGWSSKDGKFNVTADLVKINELTVTLKRQDNDKEIEVPLEKLSKGDNDYVDNLK